MNITCIKGPWNNIVFDLYSMWYSLKKKIPSLSFEVCEGFCIYSVNMCFFSFNFVHFIKAFSLSNRTSQDFWNHYRKFLLSFLLWNEITYLTWILFVVKKRTILKTMSFVILLIIIWMHICWKKYLLQRSIYVQCAQMRFF